MIIHQLAGMLFSDLKVCTLCGTVGEFNDLAGYECYPEVRKDVPKLNNAVDYKPQEATRPILSSKKTKDFIKKVTKNG